MLNNVYSALSGAVAQEKVLDIIANNLANVNTVGFKGESISFTLLEPEPERNYKEPLPNANFKISLDDVLPLHGNEFSYVGVSGVSRDMSQGSTVITHNPFDVMIEGEGFFAVHTKDGMRYTRNGSFSLSGDGALTDKLGNPIMGKKGDIFLRGNEVKINHLGEVYQDGQLVDQLAVYRFSEPAQLERVGLNHYFYNGDGESINLVDKPSIEQGSLEGSNVNAVKSLTDMILAHRSYEAYQKAIKNFDTMMEKSSNSLGELRG